MVASIIDSDLYKFTTSYAYMKMFPNAVGTMDFNDRDKTEYTQEFLEELVIEFYKLAGLRFKPAEFTFMSEQTGRFIPCLYWEWLVSFKFDASKIRVSLDKENHLHIKVTDLLYKATLYEVPILAIVSELRNKFLGNKVDMSKVIANLRPKVVLSNQNQLSFSEFGTRRRFSYNVQDQVCNYLADNASFLTGTSNCHFAMKYGLKMMGTHPHEWFMFHGAQYGYKNANYLALENWVNVYDGDLGIALSDTYTTDVFLANFSKKHAKLFDGVRQDSGDPYAFVNKVIKRYKELGIDPTTKTIVFSNALDFPTALQIKEYCGNRIRCAFGIGTNLTNDTGFKPSNIVMKLTSCSVTEKQKPQECIKISDDLGKHTGYEKEVSIFYNTFNLKNESN